MDGHMGIMERVSVFAATIYRTLDLRSCECRSLSFCSTSAAWSFLSSAAALLRYFISRFARRTPPNMVLQGSGLRVSNFAIGMEVYFKKYKSPVPYFLKI